VGTILDMTFLAAPLRCSEGFLFFQVSKIISAALQAEWAFDVSSNLAKLPLGPLL